MDLERARRWLAAVQVRRSRRSFDGRPLSPDALGRLGEHLRTFRPYPDARVVLVTPVPADLFTGIIGSYGRVRGAVSAFVFVGPTAKGADHHVGYAGEAAILEATSLGLQTCWVGGMFAGALANDLAESRADERVYAVSPVGHATEVRPPAERLVYGPGGDKPRLPLETMAPGWERWPEWAATGARAVRLAPSAMHRQPWRLRMTGDGVVLSADGPSTPLVTKRLDVGIAMLHFEVGARAAGGSGAWEDLEQGRDVALWRASAEC